METANQAYSGVLISAPRGRSGKTTITLALCSALQKQGLVVQPFKKGPDYIDPSWLTSVCGRDCRNLDLFLMSESTLISSYQRACYGADVAVIEGAMGLFDGLDSGWGSTAQIAHILDIPIILVVDTTRMTNSVAALVSGFQHFQPDVTIAGVILNKVSGSRHEDKLRNSVERHCGIPVVGCIPRSTDLRIDQRHLGLIPFSESVDCQLILRRILDKVEDCFDVNAILSLARSFKVNSKKQSETNKRNRLTRIGVIKDQVFNFYYPDNLEALEEAGAELVFINSLEHRLPEIDALYLGGGFPELFLEELQGNRDLRKDIRDAVDNNLPVYAECAGLMYLCKGISHQDHFYEMVGAIPAEIEMRSRPQGHGYVVAEVIQGNPFFPIGSTIRGHEFHHSCLIKADNLNLIYQMRRGRGINGMVDGILHRNVFASYTHLHALGTPEWAARFVSLASQKNNALLSV